MAARVVADERTPPWVTGADRIVAVALALADVADVIVLERIEGGVILVDIVPIVVLSDRVRALLAGHRPQLGGVARWLLAVDGDRMIPIAATGYAAHTAGQA